MFPRIVAGHYISDYIIRLRFEDGIEGDVDLRNELWGPIFNPLRDPVYFRQFRIHPELHTVVWENGADFSPEFLYDQICGGATPQPISEHR
jgi:hypothetical protein